MLDRFAVNSWMPRLDASPVLAKGRYKDKESNWVQPRKPYPSRFLLWSDASLPA